MATNRTSNSDLWAGGAGWGLVVTGLWLCQINLIPTAWKLTVEIETNWLFNSFTVQKRDFLSFLETWLRFYLTVPRQEKLPWLKVKGTSLLHGLLLNSNRSGRIHLVLYHLLICFSKKHCGGTSGNKNVKLRSWRSWKSFHTQLETCILSWVVGNGNQFQSSQNHSQGPCAWLILWKACRDEYCFLFKIVTGLVVGREQEQVGKEFHGSWWKLTKLEAAVIV